MFDVFSDAAKVAQQLEIIASEFPFAIWETCLLYTSPSPRDS